MSRHQRLLKIAKAATDETLEPFERVIYPYLARGIQGGKLLDSQVEGILKALSVSTGISLAAIKRSYKVIAKVNPNRNKGVEQAGPYLISGGVICLDKLTRDGPVVTPLCSFDARIVEERMRDDGVEKTLVLVIEGKLASGQALPQVEIPAHQFAAMNWPMSVWGSRANVYAGLGARDHTRSGIQTLSGDVPRRTTYTHLGWREIEGEHYFLHAGGFTAPVAPIAPENIQVEPPQGLESFLLPEPPVGEKLQEAVRSSLEVLDLAPDAITVPLLGMVYRAPFGDVDFGGHLAGQTGEGKSELAAICQQHYGADLDARNLPGSWSSTANALEGLAFAGKDVLVTVDDFAPEGSSYDVQRYHATAARLFRAQGNNSGRGRMRADGSLRPDKPPRGLILSTGEDIPKGHSIKARALILELERGSLDWGQLTTAQQHASSGFYAAAMAGFIGWLAKDYEGLTATFKADHLRYRDYLQNNGHKRTVDAGSQLLATYHTFLVFALEVGAITQDEHAAFWQRIEAGIKAALAPQAALQAHSDPVARFGELLTGLFVSGRAHVADAESGEFPGDGLGWESTKIHNPFSGSGTQHHAKGVRIGWVDGTDLYLEPQATYAAIQGLAKDQGDGIPVTERTLWKRLRERGVVVAGEDGHTTVKRTFMGAGRIRVLRIPVYTSFLIGAIGADGTSTVQDEPNPHRKNGAGVSESGQSGQRKSSPGPRSESAPKVNGAAKKNGAGESASGTGESPNAPDAPENIGVETPAHNPLHDREKTPSPWTMEVDE